VWKEVRAIPPLSVVQELREAKMATWTLRMTATQAAESGEDGHFVLNGAADGPATRILQDRHGADVRAKTQQEAREALIGAGHHYPHVELKEHEFPDTTSNDVHRVKVWVPGNRITPVG
jgi:hypothetical protein